jgi:hypothetical protein
MRRDPVRRAAGVVDPKDIAALAAFLAKSICGQIVPIDGDRRRN